MPRTIRPNLPEPGPTLRELGGILREVYQALQHGAQQGRETFDLWKSRPEVYLFGDMVRYHAKAFLDRAGHRVQDDVSFQRQDMRNNGLSLVAGKYRLRVWKADRAGGLPDPASSPGRVRYCRQLQLPFAWAGSPDELEGPFNLVVLWSVDFSHNIHEVRLVCPAAGSAGPTDVEEYWNVLIPDPVTTIKLPALPDDPDGYEDEPEDLDITRLDVPATGTFMAE